MKKSLKLEKMSGVDIEQLIKKFKISKEVFYRVYCRGERPSREIEDMFLRFEEYVVSELNLNLRSLVESYCSELRREFEVEIEVTIPILHQGECRELKIVKSSNEIKIINSKELDVCEKPNDVILGDTTIYIRCGDKWIHYIHDIRDRNQLDSIRKILS